MPNKKRKQRLLNIVRRENFIISLFVRMLNIVRRENFIISLFAKHVRKDVRPSYKVYYCKSQGVWLRKFNRSSSVISRSVISLFRSSVKSMKKPLHSIQLNTTARTVHHGRRIIGRKQPTFL